MGRCRHEQLAAVLEAIGEEALNKNETRLATGLGGQHLNKIVANALKDGLLDWTGEPTRLDIENYGQKLLATDRGKCWLELWRLLSRVEDPTSKIRVTIKDRAKTS